MAQAGRPRSHLTLRERQVRQAVKVRVLGLDFLDVSVDMVDLLGRQDGGGLTRGEEGGRSQAQLYILGLLGRRLTEKEYLAGSVDGRCERDDNKMRNWDRRRWVDGSEDKSRFPQEGARSDWGGEYGVDWCEESIWLLVRHAGANARTGAEGDMDWTDWRAGLPAHC